MAPDDDDRVYLTMSSVPFPGPWAKQAACRDEPTSTFYDRQPDAAKLICSQCPVIVDCRSYAMRYPMLRGVWGGYSESDRKRARRSLPRLAAQEIA